jgi:hypothetical protein
MSSVNCFSYQILKFSSPLGYTWKRVAFRSLVVLVLLFVCATMPNFSMFLDLVGGSTVTLLTFVFPPFFYMRLVDMSSQNPAWEQRYTCLNQNNTLVKGTQA